MSNLKFAETHKLVTFLEKPKESDRIKHYGLTVMAQKLSIGKSRYKPSREARTDPHGERVKKLERRNNSSTPGLKRLRKGRKIDNLDADLEVTLVDEAQGRNDDNLMFDTGAKDKGKEKMIEPEKPLKNKDQILIDEEIAQKLQAQLNAELEEEEKLAKQREEDANIAEWDNVQAMIDVDYELAITQPVQSQNKSFDEVQKAFNKTMGWITQFSKRAGTELEQERIKKQKIDDDQEEAEMKKQ
ncbi:hypothetical protein Tco_1500300 [Tanacetum coccineum]